jgi:hypothetical protein
MRKIAFGIALGVLVVGAVVVAGQKSYRVCKISNGQIFSCEGSWFQGETPVLRDGAWHKCKISNGQIFSCDGSWFQGNTVVFTDR